MAFFEEGTASEKSENHRINIGDLWWAWVDLNHRPRPYQDSVVRSYKDLQVPRGLPKTAQGRTRPLKLWVELWVGDLGFRGPSRPPPARGRVLPHRLRIDLTSSLTAGET